MLTRIATITVEVTSMTRPLVINMSSGFNSRTLVKAKGPTLWELLAEESGTVIGT